MKTITVKSPKSGDIICEATESFSYDIAVVLVFDGKKRSITELLPTGETRTYWVGTHYNFTILCPEK